MSVSDDRQFALLQQHFGVWVYTVPGEVLSYSSVWLENIIGGRETSTRSPRDFLRLVPKSDRHKLLKKLRWLCSGLTLTSSCELRLHCFNGETHYIQLNAAVAGYGPNGQISTLMGTATSIQERVLHEESLYDLCQKLQSSETRYRALLHDAKSPIIVIDCETKAIVDVNNAASTVTGYFKAELLKMKMSDLIEPLDCNPRLGADEALVEEYQSQKGLSLKCKNRKEIMVDISCSNVSIQDKKLKQCILHDISLHKRTEEALRHMASHDPLTGLPNRDLLAKHLETAISQARKHQNLVAICFVDLNKFKQINDMFGHDVGDFVLKNFAARLSGSIRNSDTAARLGGDEFIFILRDIDYIDSVKQAMGKIINHLHVPYGVNGTSIDVHCSIGISIYPHTGTTSHELLHIADKAMYHAKKNGMDFYIWPRKIL